jgi:hypothetical protein
VRTRVSPSSQRFAFYGQAHHLTPLGSVGERIVLMRQYPLARWTLHFLLMRRLELMPRSKELECECLF